LCKRTSLTLLLTPTCGVGRRRPCVESSIALTPNSRRPRRLGRRSARLSSIKWPSAHLLDSPNRSTAGANSMRVREHSLAKRTVDQKWSAFPLLSAKKPKHYKRRRTNRSRFLSEDPRLAAQTFPPTAISPPRDFCLATISPAYLFMPMCRRSAEVV